MIKEYSCLICKERLYWEVKVSGDRFGVGFTYDWKDFQDSTACWDEKANKFSIHKNDQMKQIKAVTDFVVWLDGVIDEEVETNKEVEYEQQ